MMILKRNEEFYPEKFRELEEAAEDPSDRLCPNSFRMPKRIYCEGDLSLLDGPVIAVVGSRKASAYGMKVAAGLGKRAAAYGVTVISGMAQGIDSAAQQGALDAGGRVIAVFGCGIDVCYPRENRKLMDRIASEGLLISEYPPGTQPRRFFFPQRNRLISALSDAVVIVEAAVESGALMTAYYALDQGKRLYAVPGNITSRTSMGTNKLIQDSVQPVVSLDTPFEDLPVRKACYSEEKISGLGEDEQLVFRVLRDRGELMSDQIGLLTGLSPMRVSQVITLLEMKGIAANYMGRTMLMDVNQ
ncbi:DNA-processing protein DprA [Eubacterium pyruvativorans]|uniref:DNA-processing protein DprA n=1 Tax=Eubacterium pyruvativorans TaxID=155865 RepID=UPI0008921A51|nr:DNA-processing protein DprA [Eubacterium pyruvativorans]MDO5568423.1 DNA-processing protein DprA [Eubacteriales bacterium]MDY4048768.1 DNA-processing protein DprA [Eubacterium pyruvativorans]SDE87108.1 DNA protecting protein DprA [Eubacterium pyruvativorans]